MRLKFRQGLLVWEKVSQQHQYENEYWIPQTAIFLHRADPVSQILGKFHRVSMLVVYDHPKSAPNSLEQIFG